jgi:hypothetical protein
MRRSVKSSLKTQLRPDQNRFSDPMSPVDQVFFVPRFETGSLSFDVIEILVLNGQVILG